MLEFNNHSMFKCITVSLINPYLWNVKNRQNNILKDYLCRIFLGGRGVQEIFKDILQERQDINLRFQIQYNIDRMYFHSYQRNFSTFWVKVSCSGKDKRSYFCGSLKTSAKVSSKLFFKLEGGREMWYLQSLIKR